MAPAHGPALHLIASYPADGQGTNAPLSTGPSCDAPTPVCSVPTDAPIELRFDRFLLPGGGLASGLILYTGNSATNRIALQAEYDLVERVVVLRPLHALQPHALYNAEIGPQPNPSRGFWAFDGAPLEPGSVPLRFSFTTGDGPAAVAPTLQSPPSDTCASLAAGPFQTCAECHHAIREAEGPGNLTAYPPMGLDLSSARGLADTAVGHVAHEAQTGESLSGPGLRTPARFGVQMSVIDPGNPATSYLIYKLLEKPENFRLAADEAGCTSPYHPPVSDSSCGAPEPAETSRLAEWFVLGEPMPMASPGSGEPLSPPALHRSDLLRIATWISLGAPCSRP